MVSKRNQFSTFEIFLFLYISSHVVSMDDENLSCAICWEPFEFGNDKFKVEIMDNEFIKDHKIHESRFHEKCITKWIKAKINQSCPICRKQLKQKFSIRVIIEIKKLFSNPGFRMLFFAAYYMMNLHYMCAQQGDRRYLFCQIFKVFGYIFLFFDFIILILHRRNRQ